jgi:hypothetical protein
MEAGTTRFERALITRVRAEAEKKISNIGGGCARDYADYKYSVGYAKALGDVLRWIEETSEDVAKEGF